jgi:Calcineurin-like phosphoesterase/Purple acid Phosphatase, N-terminal domain
MTLQASIRTSPIWLHRVSLLCVAAALLAVPVISPSFTQAQGSVLVPAGAVWKYLDTGADQGTAWRAPAFNDGGWKTGAAELGYGDGDEATLVGFGPNSSAKYPTTYFRHAFSVADRSAYGGLTLRVLRDDGAIVYLNGTEVFRSNMPASGVTAATFASSVVFDANERTYVTADVNPARLVAGTNVLAVELHQSGATSSDVSFNLALTTAGGVTVTRGPYLQRGTPSSTRVRWRTSAPVVGRVQYGQSAGAHTWAAEETTATTEHAVTLTGLLPDTTYYYSVGTGTTVLAGGDASHFFLTPPVAGTAKATRVWVLGDSGTANANVRAVRDAYYAFTGTRHTNLWLMLGDNAYPNGTDAEYQAAVFDVFPAMLRKSVLWSTLGNHDGYTADSASQTGSYYDIFSLPRSGEAGGLASGTEAYYSFDYANIHFICLESFETNRSASGPMLTWLRNDLANTTQPWIVAFFHHPPYSKGSHDSDTEIELKEMRQNALPILENAGVDLVLSGHSHSYERSFLIDGHYGTSGTFSTALKKNGGSGREDGTGAYRKPTYGMAAHEGAVYAVAGSSGQATGGALNHPAMFLSLNSLGSLVLDVNGNRLDAAFLDHAGVRRDYFTILKGTAAATAPSAPTNLRTTARTVSRIDLAWTDTSSDESGFELQRSADNVTFTRVATRESNVTSYSDTGLKRNRRYYYRVRAFRSGSPALYSPFSNTLAASTGK